MAADKIDLRLFSFTGTSECAVFTNANSAATNTACRLINASNALSSSIVSISCVYYIESTI